MRTTWARWNMNVRELWFASDPDLSRFRFAARAVVSLGGALLLLTPLAAVLPLTAGGPILGSMFGLLSGLFVTERSWRAQLATFALMPGAAGVALVLGTLGQRDVVLETAVFVPTIFVTLWIHRFGARGFALGMAAFNGFIFALFLRAEVSALPGLSASIVIGTVLAAGVRFLVIPDLPHRMVRRSLRALPPLIGWLMREVAGAVRDDSPRKVKRVRAVLARLNQAALALEASLEHAIEERLANGKSDLRARVFDFELAAGRVVSGAAELVRVEGLVAPIRGEVVGALEAARAAMHGDASAPTRVRAHLDEARRLAGSTSTLRVILTRLALSLDDLLGASELASTEPSPALARLPPIPRPPEPGIHMNTRQAIQATVASTVAMFVGRWISPDWWYVAVLAAYLVVVRMPSRGAIFLRAWQRAAGTVVGVGVGMALAAVIAGNHTFELVLMFAFVFVGFYALRTSYAVMVGSFTAIIAILYSLLGQYSHQLLYLRLGETLAGAALGAGAAALILPSPTGAAIRQALSRVVAASAEMLDAMAEQEGGPERALPRARQLDQTIGELRAAAEPLTASAVPVGRETVMLVNAAITIGFYLRQLSGPEPLDRALAAGGLPLVDALRGLAARLRDVDRGLLAEGSPDAMGSLRSKLVGVRSGIAAAQPDRPPPEELELVLLWLQRIDAKADEMAGVLTR